MRVSPPVVVRKETGVFVVSLVYIGNFSVLNGTGTKWNEKPWCWSSDSRDSVTKKKGGPLSDVNSYVRLCVFIWLVHGGNP